MCSTSNCDASTQRLEDIYAQEGLHTDGNDFACVSILQKFHVRMFVKHLLRRILMLGMYYKPKTNFSWTSIPIWLI